MTTLETTSRDSTGALAAPRPDALILPCTGQTLRLALARRDLRTLDELTRHLRVAGYHFEPLQLAEQLLGHGCACVTDAFGHEVPVQVRVPRRETLEARDETRGFLVAF